MKININVINFNILLRHLTHIYWKNWFGISKMMPTMPRNGLSKIVQSTVQNMNHLGAMLRNIEASRLFFFISNKLSMDRMHKIELGKWQHVDIVSMFKSCIALCMKILVVSKFFFSGNIHKEKPLKANKIDLFNILASEARRKKNRKHILRKFIIAIKIVLSKAAKWTLFVSN